MKKGSMISLWRHKLNSVYAGDAWLRSTKVVLVVEQRETKMIETVKDGCDREQL